MKKLISRWYLFIVIGFILFAALVFAICGEDSIIAVHDNLDLFIPQFQMMKNTGTFWSHNVQAPFLGGISRDVLPAEFSLYTILYMILPSYWAYVAGYLLKIVIALVSCILLAKDFCKEEYEKYKPLAYLSGLAYGILNVFPAFGISFASIPLVIYLIRKIYSKPAVKWYIALFFYPLLSYFSYFGLFILGYLVIAFIWLWIKDRKFPGRLLLALPVLSLGYVACEYRLFATMLLSDEVTIRSTMESGSLTAGEIIGTIGQVLAQGMFHAESVHTYLVLPVCVIYFLYLNITYLKIQNGKGIFRDPFNLLMLVLVFNSLVYGLYYWEGLRRIIETICPPLTGWQFNRTIFFSPFVWYGAFFLVLKRLYDSEKKLFSRAADVLAVAAVLVIVLSGTRYNDLYHTCKAQAYELLKGKQTDALSYGEFYSEELFQEAKEDIGYSGQWSAAYGFYPATLEYNGIATLDGYLGFYAQSYKEQFREVIEPALERVEASKEYYDTWGARAYLYSGTDISIVNAYRTYNVTDNDIYIDIDAFKELGGRYIFSRIELGNAQEVGLALKGVYTHESSPYTLYVYQTVSRYKTKDEAHGNVTFRKMQELTYDGERIEKILDSLKEMAAKAQASGQADAPEEAVMLYQELEEELTKLATCNSIAQLVYYQNVFDEENRLIWEETMEDAVLFQDETFSALREVCDSPYREAMEEMMDPSLVDFLIEYEDMTDREKELTLKENSLIQEYEQAAQENYYFEYQGEEWDFDRLMEEALLLPQEDYVAIYQGLFGVKNSVVGEIFLELVQIRNELAQLAGYDNYAEYAYAELYVRDYTLKDVEGLFKEIKHNITSILWKMDDAVYSMGISDLYDMEAGSAQEIFEDIGPFLDQIDPELKDSYDHMLEYEMYDMDTAEGKGGSTFTISLPYFQDAFIFHNAYGDYYDYTTAIHEFGHYNQTYHNTEGILEEQSNIDVAEMHSQGLEMLYYDYYEEILGEEMGGLFGAYEVNEMAQKAIDAALISEFEIYVYQHPEMSLEDMNKLYYNMSGQYGIYYIDGINEVYTWSEIGHIFNAPCYYISYLTSALSSLDILGLSHENRQQAVETYMELTTLPTYVPYCSAVEDVGLRDIFSDGVAEEIIREAADVLGVQ